MATCLRKCFGIVVLIAMSSGCAHKTVLAPDAATAKSEVNGKGMSAQVIWLKNKKNAVDVMVRFTNTYSHSVFLKNKAFQLTVDNNQRGLKNSTFAFELAAGESVEKVLIFDFGESKPKTGTATLTMAPSNTENGSALPILKIELPLKDK